MKRKGTGWIVVGVLMLLSALTLTLRHAAESFSAEQSSAEVLEVLLPQVIPEAVPVWEEEPTAVHSPAPEEQEPTVEDAQEQTKSVNGIDYSYLLSIPALDLNLPVCTDWNYQNLQTAPCCYYGSLHSDDLIICAHNYKRHFGGIGTLTSGDDVALIDMNGNVFTYSVADIITLGPHQLDELSCGEDYDLTLFTCTPGGLSRVVVRCVQNR